jgi:hypothetical protein
VECPSCYTEEETGFGFGQFRKVHLSLEEVSSEGGYTYYQCPRCGHTKKRKERFFSNGVAQPVSIEEAVSAQDKKKGGIGGKIVIAGVAALIIAAASAEKK